jgi:hypothetical protein
MWNKIHTRSNAETEDGEDEEKELMDPSFPQQQTPIVDVWHHNFDQQLAIITALASQYPVIALVTTSLSRILNFQATAFQGNF